MPPVIALLILTALAAAELIHQSHHDLHKGKCWLCFNDTDGHRCGGFRKHYHVD